MQPFKSKFAFSLLMLIMTSQLTWAQQGPPPALVKTAPATATEMAPTRAVAAYSKSKYITTIKAQSSGQVIKIANLGQVVEQGEPLGLIADEEYTLRLDELRNAIASQQAQVDFLKSESLRLKSLETQNLTSRTALEKNAAELKAGKADLAQARSRLQQIENDISNLTPKAPYQGFVTEQLAQPGQFLIEGQDFLQIMSADETEILAQLPYKLKSVLQVGAQWQFIDQAGNSHQAEVERFIPAATSNSRQIQVHLKDLSAQLLPGEPVQLMVPESQPQTIIAVPRDALVLRRQGAYIFTIKDNIATKVNVTTGLASGNLIAVQGNVAAGDQVVIRGNERLRDQQAVQLME